MAASPNTGVNTLTGEGLAGALANTTVVIDVSNSPSFEDAAALEFFETSTRNLLAAETAAGVGHHVALSVVGTERLQQSGYFRAKSAQEKLIENSAIPYSILRRPKCRRASLQRGICPTDPDRAPRRRVGERCRSHDNT